MEYSNYFDMHIHLLPGVDDGSKSMDITKQMLVKAYNQGVRNFIATPHYISGRTHQTKEDLKSILGEVKKEAKSIVPDIQIHLGNELYYSESIISDLIEGRAATLCESDYVLVEFATNISYNELYQAMRRFLEVGYRPILAHVERYECLYKENDKLAGLISLGVYIQMNATSIMGGFLDSRASYCRTLINQGMVHLLGSDAHGAEKRPPIMLDAVKILEKKRVPETLLEQILFDNPERIIHNKYI